VVNSFVSIHDHVVNIFISIHDHVGNRACSLVTPSWACLTQAAGRTDKVRPYAALLLHCCCKPCRLLNDFETFQPASHLLLRSSLEHSTPSMSKMTPEIAWGVCKCCLQSAGTTIASCCS
jgi:hypothetical protein